jgi:predicted RecA/RadA family phage recombinase
MKTRSLLTALAALALLGAACVAQAAGVPVHSTIQQFMTAHPDAALGLGSLAMAGITSYVQPGEILDLDPGATVASGTGHLFGAALFGVATTAAVSGTASPFITEGVVTIAKTSALAISVGDRLFWDATNSVVNKTLTAQQQVGIAVEAAANPSPTVKMKIKSGLPVAT